MFLAGEFVHAAKDFLVSLKDVCSVANKPLCVMGYDKEIEAVEQIIPKNIIAREFVLHNTLANELKTMLNSDDGSEIPSCRRTLWPSGSQLFS